MGWGLRLLAVFALLASFALGLWLVSLLCLVYLAISFRPRGGKGRGNPKARSGPPSFSKRHLLSAAFLILALVALSSGGVASPVVFFGIAATVFFWPRLGGASLTRTVTPARDSVLLRRVLNPFAWYCLVEVKFGTGSPSRFLPVTNGPLIISGDADPHVYTLVGVTALDHSHAERKIIESLRERTRLVAQRGAYLLPLDSSEASAWFRRRLEPLKVRGEDLVRSGPVHDVLVLDHEGGMVKKAGAFSVRKEPGRWPSLPHLGKTISRHPLLWEVLEGVPEGRWPRPDECSGFLGSMSAMRGEPLEERLKGEETRGGLALQCAGSETAVLTRAQLRAVASVYA